MPSDNTKQALDDLMNKYGHPYDAFGKIAEIWSTLLDADVTREDVGRCMVAFELVRNAFIPHQDSRNAIEEYSYCLEKIQERQEEIDHWDDDLWKNLGVPWTDWDEAEEQEEETAEPATPTSDSLEPEGVDDTFAAVLTQFLSLLSKGSSPSFTVAPNVVVSFDGDMTPPSTGKRGASSIPNVSGTGQTKRYPYEAEE